MNKSTPPKALLVLALTQVIAIADDAVDPQLPDMPEQQQHRMITCAAEESQGLDELANQSAPVSIAAEMPQTTRHRGTLDTV